VYKPCVAPPELPLYVWVDFGSLYTGPSFFRGNNPTWRRGWVPVHAETRNGRTAIPLRLAFAWTVWKAQGQTFHGKVLADLGAKERAHGLIYTALSRVTKLEHLGIQNGVPRDQCDGVPDKMACRKNEEARLRRLATATMERLEQRRER
jgi:hypothetical protein